MKTQQNLVTDLILKVETNKEVNNDTIISSQKGEE